MLDGSELGPDRIVVGYLERFVDRYTEDLGHFKHAGSSDELVGRTSVEENVVVYFGSSRVGRLIIDDPIDTWDLG